MIFNSFWVESCTKLFVIARQSLGGIKAGINGGELKYYKLKEDELKQELKKILKKELKKKKLKHEKLKVNDLK